MFHRWCSGTNWICIGRRFLTSALSAYLAVFLRLILARLELLVGEECKGGSNENNGVHPSTESTRGSGGLASIRDLLRCSLGLWIARLNATHQLNHHPLRVSRVLVSFIQYW